MWKTVKDMYGVSNQARVPLLSTYNSVFWLDYIAHYDEFDNVFKTLYKSFRFFDQEPDETVMEVTNNFIELVKNWLRMNDKRYNELWRINVVDDSKYGILDNYDMTETYIGLNTIQSAGKEGARTDVNDFTEGSQNGENQTRISAYNTNSMASKNTIKNSTGTRNDVNEFTKGEMNTTFASNEGNQHTMNRKGNIGIRTQTEVMEKHGDYWKRYNFYMFVFEEIQKQFLLV